MITLIILLLIVIVAVVCFAGNNSRSHYETTDVAFEMCQKDCLERGHSKALCADPQVLTQCILKARLAAGDPRTGAIFDNPAIESYSLDLSSDLEKLCSNPDAAKHRFTYNLCGCRAFTGQNRENCVACVLNAPKGKNLFQKCSNFLWNF